MILKSALATLLASAALFLTSEAADATVLDSSEAGGLIGGAVTMTLAMESDGDGGGETGDTYDESDWWAKCVADLGCTASAEKNNGLSCPSSFTSWGGWPAKCQGQTCVISCAKPLAAEICRDDWFWDCYYDSSLNSPGHCGAGATGKCPYNTTWHDGINWKTCTLAGGCVADGGTINCGIAHSCYSID